MEEEKIEIEPKSKIVSTIVDGEKVYLKKGAYFGWRVIRQIKNEDGSWNWKNLISGGSWLRLILIIGFVAICLGAIFEVAHFIELANECVEKKEIAKDIILNWSNLSLG
jgi:hypothetical protein